MARRLKRSALAWLVVLSGLGGLTELGELGGSAVTLAEQSAGAPAAPAEPPAPGAGPVPVPPPSGPKEVTFYGNPAGTISSGVVIPAGRASMWISGTTPPVLKADAPAGSRERFGDTKTQATGIFRTLEKQLGAQGLTMKDVVYTRAYLVGDPAMQGKLDTAGWNDAYREVFGTAANPTKTARSTVGVAALVNPDWLIEIEAFAVFPQ
jgi:enamine deaminase RidA (YjgF/YER057c/UK114 family)